MPGANSKKLLVIRPVILNDDFTIKFSYPASSSIGSKALAEGWTLTELAGNAATLTNLEGIIQTEDPDFIIHYDHGDPATLFGQINNVRDRGVLTPANITLLSWAVVSTVSCSSALRLGPLAVAANKRNEKAYLGYDAPMGCAYRYTNCFARAANAANYALLEGKSFQEAQEIGRDQYTIEINKLLALNDPTYINWLAVLIMFIDRDHFKVIGNGSAHAYG